MDFRRIGFRFVVVVVWDLSLPDDDDPPEFEDLLLEFLSDPATEVGDVGGGW